MVLRFEAESEDEEDAGVFEVRVEKDVKVDIADTVPIKLVVAVLTSIGVVVCVRLSRLDDVVL